MKINKYILDAVVLICGAVVMIFEMVGSRVLAPYIGTSIYVWTSLIGVILGSLSMGYYFGGKIADKKPNYNTLALIIFISSVFIGLTIIFKQNLLEYLQNNYSDIKISSFLASLFLFMPTSFLLGMVTPYAVKLKLHSLNSSGTTVGNLFAVSTAGSIIGTFLSGFYLIPYFGTNNILIFLLITLIVVSLMLSINDFLKIKVSLLMVMIIILFSYNKINYASANNGLIDIDTAYNRIWIYDSKDIDTNRKVKNMEINSEVESSMFLESDELVNDYAKFFHLAKHFNPNFKTTLMLGGAGYSYPNDFLSKYPNATIDVVEIDPTITDLAKKYFRLKDNPRLTTYNQDARVYLNKTDKKYDIIFGDAFGSHYSIPFQLSTLEAIQKEYDILNNDGVAIMNVISSLKGDMGKFLNAEYATYKKVFPQVYLFPVQNPTNDVDNGYQVQNIMIVAIKSDQPVKLDSTDPILNGYLNHLWKEEITTNLPILTDDYAPVDHYMSSAIN
jgi:spermidine synthase